MTTDGPPPRHLHPVDPPRDEDVPYDPAYEPPPPPPRHGDRTDDTRPARQDMAAEQAVLGALLVDPTLIPKITNELQPSDFYRPGHETIYNAITSLHDRGHPVDTITVADHLTATGEIARIGGANYLHTLYAGVGITANIESHAKIVRDCSRLRVVIETGTKIVQLGYTADIAKVDAYVADALDTLDHAAMRYGPTTPATTSGFKDLSWILTGVPPTVDPPTYVTHQAGHALFYAGKVNGVFGDPETAKTWLAQCAIIEALAAGGSAAIIDVDHNGENHTAGRLMLLGARPEHLADPERFRYYDPQEALELRGAITDITARRPDVVLVDSLGEVFPMLGLNTNDGDEITGGLRLLSQPAERGSCVIFIDHLPKGTEARASGFAIGSIAKKRAIRGSYIRAEESVKPAPGQVGKINLFIEKDTSGELRRATPGGKYVGKFVLDSTLPHITTWSVERSDAPTGPDGERRYTKVMERVSRFVEDNDQCTGREIKKAVGGNATYLGHAIKTLIEEGFISVMQGSQRRELHHSITHYREAEDDTTNDDD